MKQDKNLIYLLVTRTIGTSTQILIGNKASELKGLMLQTEAIAGEHPCETCLGLAIKSTGTVSFTSFYRLPKAKAEALNVSGDVYITEQEDESSELTLPGYHWVDLKLFLAEWPVFSPCF